MKVLHAITNLDTGGAEKLIVDLLPKLNKKGCESDLVLFVGGDTSFFRQLKKTGVNIFVFSNSGSVYKPSHILKLIRIAKSYDLIHTHNTAPQLYGAIASMFTNTKWITTEHTTNSHHKVWWYKPIEKWMYSRYDFDICISEAAQSCMKAVAQSKAPSSSVIFNGINLKAYENALPVGKNKICSNADSKLLLMVGRLSYQKDQATIIKSLKLLPDNVELCLAGDGEEREKLESLSSKLNIYSRVHFLGTRNDVPSLLKTCDIVVQSSHIEGFGLAAVEGMAAGKPVVASNVSGLAQVVGEAGLLFDHQDERMLADQIIHLLSDSSFYKEIASKCVSRANQYSLDKMVDRYLDTYNSILE